MTEAVEILIKADDQASQKFNDSAKAMEDSLKRAERVMGSLEEPSERYNRQLEELKQLHAQGALSAEQFAMATERVQDKLNKSGNAVKEFGGKAKSTTEFFGTLAGLAGSSELASLASQLAGATEKVGQFSEVAQTGGAGAFAFKLGLVGLVATLGATVGKALGDVIFKTKQFTREMERAKEASAELDARVAAMRDRMFANQTEEIELIRDPEKKKAAYTSLLEQLDKNIEGVNAQLKASQAESDKLADGWKITGDQQEFAKQAEEQVKLDKERLDQLRNQRDAIQQLVSARKEDMQIRQKENEAKEKSEGFLESLRQEIELLKATKEEQLQIEAARNTTKEDQGEAERLMKERDALIAKAEAERELQQEREQEKKRVEDLVKSEKERLRLKEIEIEQGKEAARVAALQAQGLDEVTAKQIAAKEAELDARAQKKDDEEKKKGGKEAGSLQAKESRLLTRGDGNPMDKLKQSMDEVRKEVSRLNATQAAQLDASRAIAANTAKGSMLVPVA